jgi:hypothetical protein
MLQHQMIDPWSSIWFGGLRAGLAWPLRASKKIEYRPVALI